MGKRLAAVGMAAALGVGGLTVAAVNPLSVAGASAPTGQTVSAPTGAGKRAHRTGALKKALDKLVADGTLTQAQADKVTETVKAEVKASHQEHRVDRKGRRQEVLGVVAKAIGSTPEEVKTGLKDGTSIADQAKAKGVDRQVVVDALTKSLTARIDAAVKDGKITAERGDKAKANVAPAVDRVLDATGPGGHRRGN